MQDSPSLCMGSYLPYHAKSALNQPSEHFLYLNIIHQAMQLKPGY